MADIIAHIPDGPDMWVAFGVILIALTLYAVERVPVEVTSIAIICLLMVYFALAPVVGADGLNALSPDRLLAGFSNPALLTVLALLVIGQGMVRTGILDRGARIVLLLGRGQAWASVAITFVTVLIVSAFLNNIPVVVIFIPIMQNLAGQLGQSESKVMMGLSFAAVLGGMTTLIGSGTNLLVSSALIGLGEEPFGFFEFTVPGLMLAAVGLIYVLFINPHLLPDRSSLAKRIMERSGKSFLTQIYVDPGHRLVGAKLHGAFLDELPGMRVRRVLRGERTLIPPFQDSAVEPGDQLLVVGARKALTEATAADPALLKSATGLHPAAAEATAGAEDAFGERSVAEVMITPSSALIGRYIGRAGFQRRSRVNVLGIERRNRVYRSRMADVALEAGDVLLILGHPDDIKALRVDRDVVLMEWSAQALPLVRGAKRAALIFLGVIAFAASGVVPVVVAALVGAIAAIALGILNIREAARAIDSKIVTMIPAALAMGAAMQATGGADFLAHIVVSGLSDYGPAVVLSAFFLMTAVLANIISSKACAVLFTPIAVGIAHEIGVDPRIFAVAVVFAANCAFATPIGYQTSLLVMGPGHYRFGDFVKAGAPLVIILWLVFSFAAPWYYDL
jgi:di/tricarboxylate transporter